MMMTGGSEDETEFKYDAGLRWLKVSWLKIMA